MAKKGIPKPIKKSSISRQKNKKSNLLEKEALCCTNMPACDSAMELMQEDLAKIEVPNSWAGPIEAKGSLSSGTNFDVLTIFYCEI